LGYLSSGKIDKNSQILARKFVNNAEKAEKISAFSTKNILI